MGFKQMMLGFLLEQPAYGYEIMKKAFADFYPAGPEVNEGLLYSTLKKLENEGLVVRETTREETTATRRMVEVTPRGEEELVRWLLGEEGEHRGARYDFFIRYPFLEKCTYFNHLNREQILKALEKELMRCRQRLESFQQAHQSMQRKGVNRLRIAIMEYGIRDEELRIDWLEGLRETLPNETGGKE